jgi:hypothetical protein
VSISRTNISAGSHAMEIEVTDSNGITKSTQTDYSTSRTSTSLNIKTELGDKIKVIWNDNGLKRPMSETRHFRVLANTCNTTGR